MTFCKKVDNNPRHRGMRVRGGGEPGGLLYT